MRETMNFKALCFIGALCAFSAKLNATDNPAQLNINQNTNNINSSWSTITHTYTLENTPNMNYYIGIHSQMLAMPQVSQLNLAQLGELTARYTEMLLNHRDGVYNDIPDDQFHQAVLEFLSKYIQEHFFKK